jgi:hypothetical protein
MKKQLLNLSLIAMFVAITGAIIAAPHTTPVRSIAIPPANTAAVVIDGVADADYSASQTTTAFNVTGSTGADADFTGAFQVCYDMNRLYILWNILDDYACEIPYTTTANSWTWDNVEVFLSMDTVGTTTAYDTNTIQLRFNRGIQDSAQTPGRADQSEYDGFVYSENTATGYIIEVGIPWTAVLSDAQLPEDIELYNGDVVNGFDVSCADNDTDGPDQRDCQTAWDDDDPAMPDATEDLAWNNRTMFGVMTLSGTVAINDNSVESIAVYPNPATDFVTLDLKSQTTVEIYNAAGSLVKVVNTNGRIATSDLASGLYFAKSPVGSAKSIVE